MVSANLFINNSNITGNTLFGIRFDGDTDHTLTIRNSVLSDNEFDNCDSFTGEVNLGGAGLLNQARIISGDTSCLLPINAINLESVGVNLSPLEGRYEF